MPSFVYDYAHRMLPHVGGVVVVAPHYPGARRKETLPDGIKVRRFRYTFPYRFETLAYGQFQKTRFYTLKVLLYTISEFWTTALVCVRYQPAVINAHWLIPQGFVAVLAGRLFCMRVVISVHGSDIFTLNGRIMKKIKRFILRRADAVVVNSSATQKACRELYERDYPVIPMGIDVDRFSHVSRISEKDGHEALFVGRLVPAKGVKYLLDAVAILHKDKTKLRVRIIGDGPERARLEHSAQELGIAKLVSFEGWIQPDDLPDYLARADVFVGPSIEEASGRREALGLVLAEASAAGLPVITTTTGGTADIVQDHKTGILVPQRDAPALANALRYLSAHPKEAQAMGELGRKYVAEHFSWDSVIARYQDVLY